MRFLDGRARCPGGRIASIKFRRGTRKNLLAGPASPRVRSLDPHPTSDAGSPFFFEQKSEPNPTLTLETTPAGDPVVVAEGLLRLKTGESSGVRYRHRYEYRNWGLVACELELSYAEGRGDIVEVTAFEAPFREGLAHAYVRENPICAGQSDLLGMGRWYNLGRNRSPYASRYVPMHVVLFEKGVEGIEFSCSSELAAWDAGFCSDPGLGLYEVRPSYEDPKHTVLSLCPYCVVYRRNPTRLAGTHRLRYYLGLPFVKDRSRVFSAFLHAGTGSRWVSDADLERMAARGVKLLRFRNDYREDGPFWHDGMYPPYDEAGMAELRRIIATAHRLGMKIVPYISVKEFHPDTPGCKENQAEWRQQPGPAFPEVHTWYGSGEFGQLMCLESSWLDFRKKSIAVILNDLPWDGLYFDWCTPHPCRNPHHLSSRIHADQDAFHDFMFWARERIGPDGFLLTHLSGLPQIVVENMSDMTLIYEDQPYTSPYPEPGQFPVQCDFMPIAPRQLCGAAPAGTGHARRTIMSGLLQGHPAILSAPPDAFTEDLLREFEPFAGEDIASYRFAPASSHAAQANTGNVHAALWYRRNRALVYVGNYSPKTAKGSFRSDPRLLGIKQAPSAFTVAQLTGRRPSKPRRVKVAELRWLGIPYVLEPWGTALYRVEGGAAFPTTGCYATECPALPLPRLRPKGGAHGSTSGGLSHRSGGGGG